MSTCQKCHRDTSCLHTNPVSTKELYFLIAFIVAISQVGYTIYFNRIEAIDVNKISLIASVSVVFILIFMFLMYFRYNKQYLVLFFGCHQLKERSFQKAGIPFILCARCTGIVIGIVLSIGVFLVTISPIIALILMVPLFLDGIIQSFTSYESNNLIRLFTGILLAPGLMMIYGYLNYYIHFGFDYLANQLIQLFI